MAKYLLDLESIKIAILTTPMINDKISLVSHVDKISQNVQNLITGYDSDIAESNVLCHNISFDLGVLSGILDTSPTLGKSLPKNITIKARTGDNLYKLSTSKNSLIAKCKDLLNSFDCYGKFISPKNTDDILFELEYHVSHLEVLSDLLTNFSVNNKNFTTLSLKLKSVVITLKEILNGYKKKDYPKINKIRFEIGEIAGMLLVKDIKPILFAKELDIILDLLLEL